MQVKQISICSEFYKQKWILLKFDMKVIIVYSLIYVQWKSKMAAGGEKLLLKFFFFYKLQGLPKKQNTQSSRQNDA